MIALELRPTRTQRPRTEPPFERVLDGAGASWMEFHRIAEGYLLRFPGRGDFQVATDGRRVELWPAPGAPEATLRHLYRNQVRPLALSRQGRVVLHASAVDLQGAGLAFAGPSGQGKSTLAAAFARKGAGFLCDDGLLLDLGTDAILIEPGDPSLRLWEDSFATLQPPGAALAPPLDYTPKLRLLAGAALPHCTEPRPLRALFLLGEDAERVSMTPLPAAEALRELLRLLTVLDLDDRASLAVHFQALAKVAEAQVVLRLDYPRRFGALGDVLEAVAGRAAAR